jgi:hypothetical protein
VVHDFKQEISAMPNDLLVDPLSPTAGDAVRLIREAQPRPDVLQ